MKREIINNIYEKIRKGIENYRAAADAVTKTDILEIVEDAFNSMLKVEDDDTISVEEVSNCLREAYFERKSPMERTQKQMLEAIIQRGILNTFARPVRGEVSIEISDKYGDRDGSIRLVGTADRVEDDAILMFRIVKELPEMPYAEHFMQMNAYLHIFNKEEGVIAYFDNDGNEIEFIVPRNQALYKETIRRVRILHTLLKNGMIPAIEPSNRCSTCPYNEICYYPSENKERTGFWSRGRWSELRKQDSSRGERVW